MAQLTLLILSVWSINSISAQEPPQEVPILKQINRVNEDGSYTFGYEAADGSFKIETRDVLGNVKGMFGFVDETGELKRVSYTASNGTGFQASGNIGNSPSDKLVSSSGYTTVQSETSDSETTSRRPILILRQPSQGNGPTRAPVIQHIPRRTLVTTTSQPQTSTTPAYGEYINGRRPHPVMEPTVAPVTEISEVTEPPQTNAPPLKRILVSRRPLDDKTLRGKGGNTLRRQLISEQNSRNEDAPDVYSGVEAIPRLVPPQALTPPQAHLLATLNPQLAAVYRNQLLVQSGLRPDPLPPYDQPDYLDPDSLYDPRQTYPPITLPQIVDRNRLLPQQYPIPGVISTKLRHPAPIAEDQEYPVLSNQDRRKLKPNGRNPPPVPVRPIYQEQDVRPPPSVFTRTNYQSLREELMDYLLQYLQYRSNRVNPLLLNGYPPQYPPGYPGYPYPNQLPIGYPNPYLNAGYINPFTNPNLIYSRQPFINPNYPYPPLLPPYANQNYPLPQNLPFVNPNIQYSQQYYNGQQPIPARGYQPLPLPRQTSGLQNSVRPTQATTESGEYQLPPADLLRMFISRGMTTPSYEPTRQSPSESYGSTTSTTPRPTQRQKQPVRNLQIVGAESKLSATTVKPPEDEMEMQSR